jgi:hypothetical protein
VEMVVRIFSSGALVFYMQDMELISS